MTSSRVVEVLPLALERVASGVRRQESGIRNGDGTGRTAHNTNRRTEKQQQP